MLPTPPPAAPRPLPVEASSAAAFLAEDHPAKADIDSALAGGDLEALQTRTLREAVERGRSLRGVWSAAGRVVG